MKRWTKEEIDFAIKHFDGTNLYFIVNKLNRSRNSVFNKLNRLGLVDEGDKRKKWSDTEIDFLIQNYEEKGPTYVSEQLNRAKGSVSKQAITLSLKYQNINNFVDRYILIEKLKISQSYSDLLRRLDKVVNGQNLKILKKYINEYNIPNELTTFNLNYIKKTKQPIEYWLSYGTNISSSKLKDKLYKEGLKERKCELCGQDEEWRGKKMSLILDHINGDSDDNNKDNLRIVCPNCNATLDTHCRGNTRINLNLEKNKIIYYCSCGNVKTKKTKQCENCSRIKKRKVERPPYKQLIKELEETNYCAVGRKYGVSDNSIRKWIKLYEKIL